MSKYLVTGGAGFIGSALVRRLLEQKHEVRVVDNFSTGTRENLAGLEGAFELVEGDLYDSDVARGCVEGVDFILHQGAIPSVPRSIEDPVGSHRANVDATVNLLDAARGTKIKRFVFASSSSIYGESEELPKIETMPEKPVSPYALNKLAAEKYCILFHRFYGIPTVCLRYFNVFGPRQDPNSPYSAVISCFIAAALKGERPRVYGDGEQSRDFTYVDNVVEANLLACQARGVEGKVFNLGMGERHTLNELLEVVGRIVGLPLEPVYLPPRAGDVRHSMASIGQARLHLGYEPRVGWKKGLSMTVEWFRQEGLRRTGDASVESSGREPSEMLAQARS